MKRSLLVQLLSVLLLGTEVAAHEVRPAYFEIVERAPNCFDALWKQPSNGTLVLRLEPRLSNGLLDRMPEEVYTTNSFVVRQWKGCGFTSDVFDGTTLEILGLEHTITDVLVNISFSNGQQIHSVLKPTNSRLVIYLTGSGKLPVPAYLALGIEHILMGFDHLGFVLGLVLLVRGRARLFKTITAFTVAHSITLAAAALGYVHVNAPVIESLVALSILCVAVELTRANQGREGFMVRHSWLIAVAFGLLHGFAFAGSLADIGLPVHNILDALLLFNIGVEIGQLLFVVAVLAVMAVGRRLRWVQGTTSQRWLVSYGIGAFASYCMLERMSLMR